MTDARSMIAHELKGDKMGRITIRKGQHLDMTQERALLPFAILAQRTSDVTVPIRMDCRKLDVILKGTFCKYEICLSNYYLYPQPKYTVVKCRVWYLL